MGRAPCCDKANVKRGPWSPEEDAVLRSYVERQGTGGNWIALPKKAGLKRCGKSCRLRWLNYLRPDIKHGSFTEEEDNTIYKLYKTIGSRWSVIASKLPGRTDNDVKNYWNTKLKKRLMASQNITPIPTPTAYIHPNTSPAPPPPPPIPPPLMPAIISSATGSIEGDEGLLPGFGYTMDAQRLLFWELAQFPPLGLLESSSASSSTTMENSSNSSYANPCFTGAGAEDWLLPELGFGSGEGEFISGYGYDYGYEEKMREVVDPYYPSILPNMWETAEAKPQGLFVIKG